MRRGITFAMPEITRLRYQFVAMHDDIAPDVGIGVFIDRYSGRRMRNENYNDTIVQSGRSYTFLYFRGNINKLTLPGSRYIK